MNRPRGFTLIEMMAVLMLMALIAGAVSFSLGTNLKSVKTRAAVRDLTAAMRYTRGQAIVKHEQRALEIDVEARSYQAPGRPLIEMPEGLEMKLLTAASEQTGDSKGLIRFFPDGSSSGGRVTLKRGDHEWRVEIAWLTGEVRMEEGR
ncbi:MAG: GspH/FimT family pseudopilin [Pseudomonadota bacterium]|nr:GspH/FimT family pseudopilin [Pseudomonadota bacterium]